MPYRRADLRTVLKELRVALLLGSVMAVVAFGRAALLGVGTDLGTVVAISILAICVSRGRCSRGMGQARGRADGRRDRRA